MNPMTPIATFSGWTAVQMWSGAVAACEASQIRGFTITSHLLANLVVEAGAEEEIASRLRSGTPAEVSATLAALNETETAEKVGGLIRESLQRRLLSEASRLRRIIEGANSPSSSIAAFYRLRVIDRLTPYFRDAVPGRDEKSAGIRAALSANEALRYADRYLMAVGDPSKAPAAQARKGLLRQIRYEIGLRARPEMAPDIALAFETYLGEAGLGRDLK